MNTAVDKKREAKPKHNRFDKVHYSIIIKILSILGLEKDVLSLIKGIYHL